MAELAALVPALPAAEAGILLDRMAAAGELVAGEGGYAPAGAGVLGDEQELLAAAILARLAAEPMAPPTLATLAEDLRRPARELGQILEVLARRDEVVRVDKDLWFARAAVDDARARAPGPAGGSRRGHAGRLPRRRGLRPPQRPGPPRVLRPGGPDPAAR